MIVRKLEGMEAGGISEVTSYTSCFVVTRLSKSWSIRVKYRSLQGVRTTMWNALKDALGNYMFPRVKKEGRRGGPLRESRLR